jgi:hypothetical protein
MAVQRERFVPSSRPVIPDPEPVDRAGLEREEWACQKGEVRFWQRVRRRRLRGQVSEHARVRGAELAAEARAAQQKQQGQADAWWTALNEGEPGVLAAALKAAFADNPAPVAVISAAGPEAILAVVLPGTDVLPARTAHVTPSGRLSSRAWTKTELNEVYAQLLGAHLLATIRETWAVAPSLARIRIIGLRNGSPGPREALFDVAVSRDVGGWAEDNQGEAILQHAEHGLNRAGRAREVTPWPPDQLRPGVRRLLT